MSQIHFQDSASVYTLQLLDSTNLKTLKRYVCVYKQLLIVHCHSVTECNLLLVASSLNRLW